MTNIPANLSETTRPSSVVTESPKKSLDLALLNYQQQFQFLKEMESTSSRFNPLHIGIQMDIPTGDIDPEDEI